MSRTLRLLCLLGTWAALVLPGAGSTPEWVEVKSPHFSVVTDAGEKRGRDVALHFEQMRAAFGALLSKAKVSTPVPLQIIAFRSTKEMRQFVPLWHGKPVQLSGLFQGSDDRCFILLDMSVENPWAVVFHEYAHQLLNGNINARVQPWFDEGFAEFFSTIESTSKDASVGKAPQSSFDVLQQNRLMKVADLFRVQQNSSTYNENGDHRSLFYSESWLVVHYLYDKQLVTKLADYFNLVLSGQGTVEQGIEKAFGMSPAAFDKALQQYLNDNRFRYFIVPMPAGIEVSGYSVRQLSDLDAKAVLADSHLHSPDYGDRAITEFEEVLKLQPENAAALRGLGYAYFRKRDYDHAGEYFSRAAEFDSADARLLYYSAMLAQQKGWRPEQAAKAQQQLEKSIALDPEFADAYDILAFAYLSQGKRDQAAETMRKAVALNPRNERYLFNLVQVYLSGSKYDDAIQILMELAKSAEPITASNAINQLDYARKAKQSEADFKATGGNRRTDFTVSQVDSDRPGPSPQEPEPAMVKPQPTRFLKGTLVAVDCSTPPAAVLTVVSGTKRWKFHAKDSHRLIVIGADQFSCSWVKQKVAINYRESGENAGELVSLEVQ